MVLAKYTTIVYKKCAKIVFIQYVLLISHLGFVSRIKGKTVSVAPTRGRTGYLRARQGPGNGGGGDADGDRWSRVGDGSGCGSVVGWSR